MASHQGLVERPESPLRTWLENQVDLGLILDPPQKSLVLRVCVINRPFLSLLSLS